jgi:glycosyltransferase involved in cell wall biosynthesis
MRVLILHNRYRAEGGEERAVDELAALLGRHDHDVEVISRSSTSVGRVRAAGALLRGGGVAEAAEVAAAVRRLGADVVHAHNLHPLFGWRALAAARAAGARTVLHLHNFRTVCAVGVAYRDGAPCHACHGRDTLPGLRHRCRGSLGESAVYAAALHRQQPQLLGCSDVVAVLSGAQASRLRAFGVGLGQVVTLPNFVADGALAVASAAGAGEYALASGRLVEEKGFDTAVLAAARARAPLVVAGDGPDRARLRALAAGADVRFLGWVGPEQLASLRAGAAVVLAPSRWEEVCPYSVLDAMAAGVPALVSDRGGLPELVGGVGVLPAGDSLAWASALSELWADPQLRAARGAAALARARERHSEHAYLELLLAAYGGQHPPPRL